MPNWYGWVSYVKTGQHWFCNVCFGWGYIPLYKFWEEAQIYLSGKDLVTYVCLESECHKSMFPELVLMMQ